MTPPYLSPSPPLPPSVCATKDVCPPQPDPGGGLPLSATDCAMDSIVPTDEERSSGKGKLMSCW